MAPCPRPAGGIGGLEPVQAQAWTLLGEATPAANMAPEERQRQIEWALGMRQDDWYGPIVDDRKRALEESHERLRASVKGKKLTVAPHTPPDVLGCYVLVPTGTGG